MNNRKIQTQFQGGFPQKDTNDSVNIIRSPVLTFKRMLSMRLPSLLPAVVFAGEFIVLF